MTDTEALAAELKAFRKGRAARHPDLVRRVGPQLRALAGITGADTRASAFSKLRETVQRLVGNQVPDLLLAALVEFALHPEAVQDSLDGRQRWLAQDQRFQPRTARRRMDAAIDAFVIGARDSMALPVSEPVTSEWRVCSMEAVLHLTTDGPTLMERRVIQFTTDGLEEITCRLSVPRPNGPRSIAPQLLVAPIFGVQITSLTRPSEHHYQYQLRLPRRFRAGQRHEYAISFQIPAGQAMANHYVMQPLTPCDEFRLIARFDPDRLPQAIWMLDGVAPRVIESDRPIGGTVVPDRLGELHRSFRQLRQGFAYGVKWRP
jgi:hypothetical protein